MADDRTPAEVERARRITARQDAAARRAAAEGRQNPRAAFEQMMSPEERARFGRSMAGPDTRIPSMPADAARVRGMDIPRVPVGERLPFLTPQLEASQLARVARGTLPSAAAAAAIEGRQQLREAVGIPEARERGRQYLRAQREGGARDVSDQSVGSVEARAPRPGVGGPMMTEDRAAAPVRGRTTPSNERDLADMGYVPGRAAVSNERDLADMGYVPGRAAVSNERDLADMMGRSPRTANRPTAPRGQFRGDRRGPSEADLLNEREMTRILNERSAEKAARGENAFKKGGAIKRMAKGGAVKMAKGGAAKAPKCMARGGGIESRGKTRGKFV